MRSPVNPMPKVELFQKIRLCWQAGCRADAINRQLPDADFTFVYGIGTGGLTPFEYLLADKREGDQVSFRLAKTEALHFFGHLLPLAAPIFARQEDAFFRVKIDRIQTAEPREIVQAMAESTAHGHGNGCDCGCGCG